ncbi:hypothetical protein GlitD10_1009 [Gloeomargarita lithophora Alchichica-D10]|uniref:DUF3318 domain-containing protein n=1 Tax=Gloeomargarita lithophora Alchichica-D10 TaxID=1188229 RepID=A0A1J0ABN1_9CYAN|nr:DUF3318 domain-containing protein [Gloeomargarita lithophora]APB33327.1 hypothetical protein GlitD10_1009 [Gloeomargarita lithophora Alchichica-D10]
MDEFDRDTEIGRLLDLLPASSRMKLRVISQPQQVEILTVPFPWPWRTEWPVPINFELWQNLTEPQRDLLFLRTDRWLRGIAWFRPGWSQGLILAGSVAVAFQGVQADGVGVLVGAGLAGVALRQLLRNYRSPAYELQADESAVTIAQRREYTEVAAAGALLSALEQQAQLERRGLTFNELVRSQNLRVLAGLSTVAVPSYYRTPES